MKKRLLILILAMGLLAGCGDKVSESANKEPEITEENITEDTVTEEAVVEEQEEEEIPPPEISLIMVGDMLMHDRVETSGMQEDGTYSFDAIYANVTETVQSADLAIANMEVLLGGTELGITGYPCFNAPFELGHDLVEAGFDVFCHGSNHALDKGKTGLNNCLNFWNENYPELGLLGIHESEEDQDEIYVYEKDGIKIAILNFTYGTNGIPLPSDMPYGVDMMEEESVVAAIQKANAMADFTIVCPHWGSEYYLGTSDYQEYWKNIFLQNGVDLVLGTHPHVIEPIEMVYNEETGESMLVYYSLGNFVNWTNESGEGIANRMVGGMAQVTLGLDDTGAVYIKEYGIEPVVCHLEHGTGGVTVYFLKDYTQELAGKNEICKQDSNFSLEYCKNLCTQVWGDLWLQ